MGLLDRLRSLIQGGVPAGARRRTGYNHPHRRARKIDIREGYGVRALVFSDSHGDTMSMLNVTEREQPDMLIHLGDCWRDTEPLAERFPEIPLYRVTGNCDYRPQDPAEQTLEIAGRRIFLCHGHTFGVKEGLWDAEEIVLERKLDAFLFGHTHSPLVDMRQGTLYFNPGSCGLGHPRTYGILAVGEDGKLDARTFRV